jgi:Tfp pilus assembly protein PilF
LSEIDDGGSVNSSYPRCRRFSGRLSLVLADLALFGLTGCGAMPDFALVAPLSAALVRPTPEKVAPTETVQDPADIKYYPSDEPLRMGLEHFSRGNFGLAERYFRDAVEKSPRDATAWVGLAASYDRLRRFDLADRAYASAIKLTGETVQLLNNEGYSYMLRGNLTKARVKFMKAYELDPMNPTIVNNLELLDSSDKFVRRPPE